MNLLCEDCREEVPARETIVVTDKVLASTSRGTRIYRGTRGGVGVGGSSSSTYRYVERTICLDCAAERAAAIRRARRARAIAVLGTIGAIGLAGALAKNAAPNVSTGNESSYAVPAYGAENATDASSELTQPEATESPDQEAATFSDQSPMVESSGAVQADAEPVSERAPDQAAAASQPADAPDQEGTDADRAIVASTLRALDSGGRARWRGAGRKGFATVSVPSITGDRECRNVDVTEIDYGEVRLLSRSTWCRQGDGDWSVE